MDDRNVKKTDTVTQLHGVTHLEESCVTTKNKWRVDPFFRAAYQDLSVINAKYKI